MRIQEHLFQGFFGIKKKQDSVKYYHERVDKLKGIDAALDNCIDEFQKILINHNTKIAKYYEFLKKLDKKILVEFRQEVKKLEGMFDPDEISADNEERYLTKIEGVLNEILKNEENTEIKSTADETVYDLKELQRMVEALKPLWEKQLELNEKSDDEFIQKDNLLVMTGILKQESDTLKAEENLLKKIDLKTGNILRKATLKMRDAEKTKDMNLNYRNIRHIR
ncbi:TPA: hypothetical protein HA235_01525 [Candidatus Woesearchaeota archaeon]|nr:hypothetical protein [Candidatus Woesearchaeota archaeon]HIH31364.1 hypothetical protein [Candidatus Woesearchaeota archaeon]HIH54430.1 hypothetical protein [Candidatus Woesearchaeota archaeon]HIJ02371.1 hypothetical protein [Candidatus Woesearchaeota archaeon]HIJ14151.1 hypothetical protein [Candidatus Woesearchaeota archaeon]